MATDYYCGEIRMFAGTYAPEGWLICDGRTLEIASYQRLFLSLSTSYGGDGKVNFKLPDLRGRVPLHKGVGTGLTPRVVGQSLGVEAVSLGSADIPRHQHCLYSTDVRDSGDPTGHYLAEHSDSTELRMYGYANLTAHMAAAMIGNMEGCLSKPHTNMMPSLAINFIIATDGI